jgi:hypothetical protein
MGSILFATHDETWSVEEILRWALEALGKAGEDHEVFVADNWSPDCTATVQCGTTPAGVGRFRPGTLPCRAERACWAAGGELSARRDSKLL